jgi:small conductance mechanosensitive channel
MEVLRQIGAELEADPKFAESILEPIDVMGLDSFADSAVIIRARIKTAPLKQWPIKREFNLRLKRRFDELGIEIPFPHQTLYFGQDKAERAPPVHVRLDPDAVDADRAAAPEAAGLRVIDTPEAPSSGRKR